MTDSTGQPDDGKRQDTANWAQPVPRLKVADVSTEAVNINVEGRRVVGPLQGFGKMWQKTYWVRLSGASATPADVIETWKKQFSEFWPEGNRFYGPLTGIAPGEVAVLNLSVPGGVRLSTGVMVIYADEESFTFMTPEGHMFSGWITFSSYESDGCVVAQTQVLIRANDPLYEIAFRLGGSKAEDTFWLQTLQSLSTHFGVSGQPQMKSTCVDPKLQWSQAKNIWYNAALRSMIYAAAAPLRWAQKPFVRH